MRTWGRLVLAVCVSALLARGTNAEPPSVATLVIGFESSAEVPAPIRRHAVLESARIWHRYDVDVVAVDLPPCASAPVVPVVSIGVMPGLAADGSLGTVRFTPAGVPEPRVTLYVDAVTSLATSGPVLGVHPALWPRDLRDQVIGRAVGRVLAHELGHIVLQSPQHSRDGLMRRQQRSTALSALDDRPFQLNAPELARLRIALAASTSLAGAPLHC